MYSVSIVGHAGAEDPETLVDNEENRHYERELVSKLRELVTGLEGVELATATCSLLGTVNLLSPEDFGGIVGADVNEEAAELFPELAIETEEES